MRVFASTFKSFNDTTPNFREGTLNELVGEHHVLQVDSRGEPYKQQRDHDGHPLDRAFSVARFKEGGSRVVKTWWQSASLRSTSTGLPTSS